MGGRPRDPRRPAPVSGSVVPWLRALTCHVATVVRQVDPRRDAAGSPTPLVAFGCQVVAQRGALAQGTHLVDASLERGVHVNVSDVMSDRRKLADEFNADAVVRIDSRETSA